MSKPKYILKVLRKNRLARWQLVPDMLDSRLWWVLKDGHWFEVHADSFEDARQFCLGLFGPSHV